MIKALIIEDNDVKYIKIFSIISDYFGSDRVEVTRCAFFAESVETIFEHHFDLIVVDLLLPRFFGDEPVDISEELVEHLGGSSKNSNATVIAISEFNDVIASRRSQFAKQAVFLLSYDEHETWQECLKVLMQRVSFRRHLDFVIICALDKERSAFRRVDNDDFAWGEMFEVEGLDCREVKIGGASGMCIKQPRMGLVDATAVATKVLSVFSPRILAMAGICGGVSGESELGQLVVSDPSWEHQAGKWDGDSFRYEAYQEHLENGLRTRLSQLVESEGDFHDLTRGLLALPRLEKAAVIAPSGSGSAVIASKEHIDKIALQHRKLAAIDMEVYGVHRAVALFGSEVHCFAAKVVTDMADEEKDDALQIEGAVLSARFVVRAISKVFDAAI